MTDRAGGPAAASTAGQFLDPGQPAGRRRMVSDAFAARFGTAPEVVGRAPGRINLIGEHTDYNGGRCLPLALPHATYAAVRRRDDDVVTIHSRTVDETWSGSLADLAAAGGWAAYAAGTLWAMEVDHGVDLLIDSSVPVGSGLSSSAALECAVAVATDGLSGRHLDEARRRELATACRRAETEVAGAPTGGMDQLVAMLAPEGDALLIDFHDDSVRAVPVPLAEVGLELLVIDTGVRHALADGAYAARRRECAAAAHLLGVPLLARAAQDSWSRLEDDVLMRRARHVLSEGERVDTADQAIVEGEWAELGAVLDASHASLAHDFEVSCEELDAAVESSRAAGALGARMTGGGFGGSAIALVETDDVGVVAASVLAEYASRGWSAPTFLRVGPSPAADTVP
ncbi:galactokinase [Nocardioides sp. JQ2195]|uniref:galactokinase n=1 Tax=Nocardioides sp. JQ2195 TaxID=2592334 RepID=UPI001F0FF400|nr:galactokinase [Nocardioides sp. JQ2195]